LGARLFIGVISFYQLSLRDEPGFTGAIGNSDCAGEKISRFNVDVAKAYALAVEKYLSRSRLRDASSTISMVFALRMHCVQQLPTNI
jgi:hypothetical protein